MDPPAAHLPAVQAQALPDAGTIALQVDGLALNASVQLDAAYAHWLEQGCRVSRMSGDKYSTAVQRSADLHKECVLPRLAAIVDIVNRAMRKQVECQLWHSWGLAELEDKS